jgi:hypothetical protein
MDIFKPAEEESEAEVRRVDQDNINKFARLNARLHELRDERELIKVCVSTCTLLPCLEVENLNQFFPQNRNRLNDLTMHRRN